MLNLLDSLKKIEKLPIPKYEIVKSDADLANLEFPCWLKVNLSEHKLEIEAAKKCNNLEEAKTNLKELRKKFPTDKIVIQESVDGIELVLGIKQDSAFGKMLMLGFGGSAIEILKDVTFITAPAERKDIEKALQSLKLYPSIIKRGKYAVNKLINLAEKVSNLEIKEADFNPVILNENEAVIVDARVLV